MLRTYSLLFRLMHWAIAFCMIGLLLTILLRLGWMNKYHMSAIIQDYMTSINQPLTEEQSIVLAKKIRKPMWEWHIYLGYALTGLYSLRMLLPLFGKLPFASPFQKPLDAKTRFQYGLYLVFYLLLAGSLITGLIIEFGPREWKKTTEEIHELSIYYLVGFMVLHIGGVLLAEFTSIPGIVSRVISGKKSAG